MFGEKANFHSKNVPSMGVAWLAYVPQ
jgi:hypothetical protein